MNILNFNPLPLVFTLATTFGVLLHDTQVDRAATVALTLPTALATYAAVDSAIKFAEHVHVEKVSVGAHLPNFKNAVPRLQARDDEHRYQQNKRMYFGAGDNGYLWPSV
jgi:hypothetical protein